MNILLREHREAGVVHQLCSCGEEALQALKRSLQIQRFYLENVTGD